MPVTEPTSKKVLIIARAFPPFLPVGHSIRMIKFVKFLPSMGWLPVVLTIDDKVEYETMCKVGSSSLLSEIPPQVKIYRAGTGEPSLKYLEKERRFAQRNRLTQLIVKLGGGIRRWIYRTLLLPDRYLTWLPFAVKLGRQVVMAEKIDVILVTSPPHSALLVGVVLKGLTGKPLLLDYRDDWIGTPWHESKPVVSRLIEKSMERWAVDKADKVILVTDWSREVFRHRYPQQPADKFVLIPNGCDLREFAALDSNVEGSKNPRFTILHAGSLNVSRSWGRNVNGFFQAIRQMLQQVSQQSEQISLVFAGDFPGEYRRLAEDMELSPVIRELGHVPHDEILRLIRSADLLLAINYDGWSTLIPGKIYEYWAVGGPPILLLSCPGAATAFVKQHNLGFAVDPQDVDGIQEALLTVYDRNRTGSPLRIKADGIQAFDRRSLTRQLAELLSMASDLTRASMPSIGRSDNIAE